MSKSMFRRLSVQIPEEEQPEFLASTFGEFVLRKALDIIESRKLFVNNTTLCSKSTSGEHSWQYINNERVCTACGTVIWRKESK